MALPAADDNEDDADDEAALRATEPLPPLPAGSSAELTGGIGTAPNATDEKAAEDDDEVCCCSNANAGIAAPAAGESSDDEDADMPAGMRSEPSTNGSAEDDDEDEDTDEKEDEGDEAPTRACGEGGTAKRSVVSADRNADGSAMVSASAAERSGANDDDDEEEEDVRKVAGVEAGKRASVEYEAEAVDNAAAVVFEMAFWLLLSGTVTSRENPPSLSSSLSSSSSSDMPA